jgi:hypothetical protein
MNRLMQTLRAARRAPTAQTDRLTALTDDTRHLLQIRWWLWRHCYLEAKRRQLETRTHRSDA